MASTGFQTKINTQFKTQLEALKKVYGVLKSKVETLEQSKGRLGYLENILKIRTSLAEIRYLLSLFYSTVIGWFNKSARCELEGESKSEKEEKLGNIGIKVPSKGLSDVAKELKKLKWQSGNQDLSDEEKQDITVKEQQLLEKVANSPELTKNLGILEKNLKNLGSFTK